jgi:hypothetical protein
MYKTYSRIKISIPKILVIFAALALGACTFNSDVDVNAAFNVYSNYENKVPGKWAFFADGSRLFDKDVDVLGISCFANTYPLDARKAFEQSAFRTFENLVENIELVNSPIAANQLSRRGFDGQIIVKSENMKAEMSVSPGFWSATLKSEVDITASVSAFSRAGRLLGTTASQEGEAKTDGMVCATLTKALGPAASDSIKRVLTILAERFTSSRRVRGVNGPTSSLGGGKFRRQTTAQF